MASAVQPHSMGGVRGGEEGHTHTHTHTHEHTHTHTHTHRNTHTHTHTGTCTRMLHLLFSDLPFKKCPINWVFLTDSREPRQLNWEPVDHLQGCLGPSGPKPRKSLQKPPRASGPGTPRDCLEKVSKKIPMIRCCSKPRERKQHQQDLQNLQNLQEFRFNLLQDYLSLSKSEKESQENKPSQPWHGASPALLSPKYFDMFSQFSSLSSFFNTPKVN